MLDRQESQVLHDYVGGQVHDLDEVDPALALDPLRNAFYESVKHGLNQLLMQGIAKDSTTYRAPSASSSALLDSVHDEATAFARKHSGDLITGVSERTQERVKAVVTEGLKNGWSVDKVASELQRRGHFSEQRAETIARTEISAAQNAGMIKAGQIYEKNTGTKVQKVWLVTGSNPCIVCQEHDGDTVDVGEEFEGGLTVPAHPRCMCEVQLVVGLHDVDYDDDEDE